MISCQGAGGASPLGRASSANTFFHDQSCLRIARSRSRNLEGSELGEHLRLSMQISSLSHVEALLRVRPADVNPDLFLLFVQPNKPGGKLRAAYHYCSAHLPFLT